MAASRVRVAGARPTTISFAPDNQTQLQAGIALLERTLASAYGPAGRVVACERIGRPGQPPELLSDGATIARRITNVPDRFSNMGLMTARHAAWRMRSELGDGAKTAVLLLAAAHRELVRLQAAGFNRLVLKHGVERFLREALTEIERLAAPLTDGELTAYARTVAGDPILAGHVEEALAVLGPGATIVTRAAVGRECKLEFIEGALWESTAVMAPTLASDPRGQTQLVRPRILLWESGIEDAAAFARLMERFMEAGERAVLVIARSFSTEVLAFIHRNHGSALRILPVIAPHGGLHQEWAYGDLAVLTGGKRGNPDAGEALDRLTIADAGRAPRATAGARFVNIFAAHDREPEIQRRIDLVRRQMANTEDEKEWKHLQLRLGRLQGGMGVLWIGAETESARDERLSAAERGLLALRNASADGVLPGGGKTLIEIAHRVTAHAAHREDPGFLAAARACEAPAQWLAKNAGLDPSTAVAGARNAPASHGLDVTSGEIVDLRAAGIVDSAALLKRALTIGLTTALLASDCGALLHRPITLNQAELRP